MNMRILQACAVLAASFAGCAAYIGGDTISKDVSAQVARSERMAAESLTLSRLTALERSLSDYVHAEGRVPKTLEALIPNYLAEIPESVLGIREHRDSSEVRSYPPSIIIGGKINGAMIRDRGGWGYAFNGERVIIFVNCTHVSIRGRPLYKMGTGLYHSAP